MISDDDFDNISIEVTTERVVVWGAAEALGSLVEGPSATEETERRSAMRSRV
jgi:hypothetical protein